MVTLRGEEFPEDMGQWHIRWEIFDDEEISLESRARN
jgi:hypothetical protein